MELKVVTNPTVSVVMAERTLADWLNEEIQKRHMSIREFSRASGVGHTTLNRMLAPDTAEVEYPSMDTLVKLSRFTKLDLCTLVAMVSPEDTEIDAEARIIAERIAQLSPDKQAIVDAYILGIALKPGNESE